MYFLIARLVYETFLKKQIFFRENYKKSNFGFFMRKILNKNRVYGVFFHTLYAHFVQKNTALQKNVSPYTDTYNNFLYMALPLEFFTEQLQKMQLCTTHGNITNIFYDHSGSCLSDGVAEIDHSYLLGISIAHGDCVYDSLADAYHIHSRPDNTREYTLLIEQNTGKLLQWRDEIYIPSAIDVNTIPTCRMEEIPQNDFINLKEVIIAKNATNPSQSSGEISVKIAPEPNLQHT